MIRLALFCALLFAAPFLLYSAYIRFVKDGDPGSPDAWSGRPLAGLLVAGTALVALGLFLFAGSGTGPTDGKYTPAHMKDGKLVPGKIDRKDP